MLYAMSDIHGCIDKLLEQMQYVNLEGGNHI